MAVQAHGGAVDFGVEAAAFAVGVGVHRVDGLVVLHIGQFQVEIAQGLPAQGRLRIPRFAILVKENWPVCLLVEAALPSNQHWQSYREGFDI